MTGASPYCPSRRDLCHLCWESKVLQIGRDGTPRAGQFTLIIAIALACIRADPLARVHLPRRGAHAHHFPRLSPGVARRDIRHQVGAVLQARPDRRAGRVAVRLDASHRCQRQCSADLADRRLRQWSPRSIPLGNYAARRACGTLLAQGRSMSARKRRESWSDEEDHGVQRARILAVSKGSPRSKKEAGVRSPLMA